ncbi:hypothetical protein LDQ62_002644 [Listeria monocytogenes]|nr:hypothetical protein [Listeria monocytogenes]
MKFKKGDRVELILRSEKRVGTVEEVYNDTQKCKVQIDGFPVTVTKLQKYLVKVEGAEGFQYRGKVHEEVFYNADDRKRATTTIK